MDDRDLEVRLRTHLHRRLDDAEPPRELRAGLEQAFATQPRRLGLFDVRSRAPMRVGFSLTAAAVVVVILAVAATNLGLHLGPGGNAPSPSPSAGVTERAFIVLPPTSALPSKAESLVAADVLAARLRALIGDGTFSSAAGYAMTFTIPELQGGPGPGDDDIRAVLAAPGDVEFVPLPRGDYGDGKLQATVGQPLPKAEVPLFDRTGIASVALDDSNPARIVVTLTPAAKEIFGAFTAGHVGESLAVLVDARVAFLPVIQDVVAGGVVALDIGTSTAPPSAVAEAVLIGGTLPVAWRGATVPVTIPAQVAGATAVDGRDVTVQSVALQAIASGNVWRAVWNVVVTGFIPVECLAQPSEPPHLASCPPYPTTELVVVDAISGAVISSEAPAP